MKIIEILSLAASLTAGHYLYTWRSPMPNLHPRLNYRECIYQDSARKEVKLTSCGADFTINYVEHSSTQCYNPAFPSIHIAAPDSCNAFLQIIYADCPTVDGGWPFFALNEHLSCRIDTVDKNNDPDKIYPFYTLCNQLYDMPYTGGHSFFQKPLSFWRAHAYAVSVDQEKKTISCIGGISWGYRLKPYSFKPTMITPSSLSHEDWKNDWKIFSTVLPDYVVIE